jgi:BirA family biotin operon repressor/biotin-[acetyl-CoA-carboxylase] ligase
MAPESSLTPFFSPRGVAVIRASATPGKLGYRVLQNLLKHGYEGEVYPTWRGFHGRQGQALLPPISMLFTLIQFQRTTSTQTWARDWARLGAKEGLAIQALEQTSGRGRLQRGWHSPHNQGLYISVLLRPAIPLMQANRLTMLVSLAAIEACQAVAGVKPVPKWPNDLLLLGRKLAGVLTELEAEGDRLNHAIIGLGLNVNTDFTGTPLAETAISLQQATGHSVTLTLLRDAYLHALEKRYQRFLSGESPLTAWKARLEPLGRRVRVIQPGQASVEGTAVDVNADGALLVQDDAGAMHTIWAGDILVN